LLLARLPRIGLSANWNENYRPYSFKALANISGNFRKISRNIRKIYNPMVPPFGGGLTDYLRTMFIPIGLIGKRIVDFLLVIIKLFFARCYG